jgi:hypothetical protein
MGATRPARLDWDRDRDRKDMTSGREKPDVDWADVDWADVDWADVDWADVDWALPSKNTNQTSFWLNS